MSARCFQVRPSDNVATLLDEVSGAATPVRLLGSNPCEVVALEPIAQAHKIALRDIGQGEAVTKFGVAIGRASKPIRVGQWVHLHNCTSNFDERSQTLDIHTGSPTDTKYE